MTLLEATMTLDLDEAERRAQLWIEPSPGDVVTGATAINEEHLALDVVALVAEVRRLRAERDELTADDLTATEGFEIVIDDSLPRYAYDDGTSEECTYHERIEYAGEELRELRREVSHLHDDRDDARQVLAVCARKLALLVRDYPGDKESRETIERIERQWPKEPGNGE